MYFWNSVLAGTEKLREGSLTAPCWPPAADTVSPVTCHVYRGWKLEAGRLCLCDVWVESVRRLGGDTWTLGQGWGCHSQGGAAARCQHCSTAVKISCLAHSCNCSNLNTFTSFRYFLGSHKHKVNCLSETINFKLRLIENGQNSQHLITRYFIIYVRLS